MHDLAVLPFYHEIEKVFSNIYCRYLKKVNNNKRLTKYNTTIDSLSKKTTADEVKNLSFSTQNFGDMSRFFGNVEKWIERQSECRESVAFCKLK